MGSRIGLALLIYALVAVVAQAQKKEKKVKCAMLTKDRCFEVEKCNWYDVAGCREACKFSSQDGCDYFKEQGCSWEVETETCLSGIIVDETASPSYSPTNNELTEPPVSYPSKSPTAKPTSVPTEFPSVSPSVIPTFSPVELQSHSTGVVVYIELVGTPNKNIADKKKILSEFESEIVSPVLESFKAYYLTSNPDFVPPSEVNLCPDKHTSTMESTTDICSRFLPYLNKNVYIEESKKNTHLTISIEMSGVEFTEPSSLGKVQKELRDLYSKVEKVNVILRDFHVQMHYGKTNSSPPNVVMMLADDLGWGDVGYQACDPYNMPPDYGERLCAPKEITPNIDLMSASPNSATFSRFYTSPQCGPSRASILTGRQPIRECILFNIFRPVPSGEIPQMSPLRCVNTVAKTLLNQYEDAHTFHVGKWHVGKLHKDEANEPNYTLAAPSENGFKKWASTPRHGPTTNYNCGCFPEDKKCDMGMYNTTFFWETFKEVSSSGVESRKFMNQNDPQLFSCDYYWANLEANGKEYEYNLQDIEAGKWTERMVQDDSEFIVDRFEDFLQDWHASSSHEPFMALLWFHAPHAPVSATPEYLDKALKLVGENEPFDLQNDEFYCGKIFSERDSSVSAEKTCEQVLEAYKKDANLDDEEFKSQVVNCNEVCKIAKANYYGSIMALDAQVGRVRRLLEEQNLKDNTILIFSSDNGPARYDASQNSRYISPGSASNLDYWKFAAHEGGTRVPFVLEFPNLIKENKQISIPASSYDFFPTVLDLLNVKYDQKKVLDGISLVPMLANSHDEISQSNLFLSRQKPIPIVTVDLDVHYIENSSSILKLYSKNRYERYEFDSGFNKMLAKDREGDKNLKAEEYEDLLNGYENWKREVFDSSPCNKPATFLKREEFCDVRQYE